MIASRYACAMGDWSDEDGVIGLADFVELVLRVAHRLLGDLQGRLSGFATGELRGIDSHADGGLAEGGERGGGGFVRVYSAASVFDQSGEGFDV